MKILYTRSNPINPDPRVEKSMDVAVESGHEAIGVGWNRCKSDIKIEKRQINLSNGSALIYNFNIKAKFGSGVKNLIPIIIWQIKLLKWMIMNRKKYDIIHACDFDTVLPALFMSKVFNKKYIYDIFDFYVDSFYVPNKLKYIIKKIDFIAINNAYATIVVNESRKEQIKGSHPKRLEIIHNTPIEKMEYTYIKNIKRERKKIFYGGILPKNRMILETINICSRHPNWEFVIAGFGPIEEECKLKAKQFENIRFLGKLPYDDIIKNTIESDVVFACYDPKVPNHKYSSPNKLYEAMMCKKPIIVCKNTGIDNVVIENEMGKVCEFDEASLESTFEEIFIDENKYQDMCKNARYIYNSEYKWDIMKNRLSKLYSDILDKI